MSIQNKAYAFVLKQIDDRIIKAANRPGTKDTKLNVFNTGLLVDLEKSKKICLTFLSQIVKQQIKSFKK